MKKILSILALFICVAVSTQAQRIATSGTLVSATYGKVTDTVTSTAAHYMVLPSGTTLPATMELTVVATCVEITGTTAGTLTCEGSVDGTNWTSLYLTNSTTALQSFTATDVANQSFSWKLDNFSYKYVRIKAVGISTPQFTIAGKWYGMARQ